MLLSEASGPAVLRLHPPPPPDPARSPGSAGPETRRSQCRCLPRLNAQTQKKVICNDMTNL